MKFYGYIRVSTDKQDIGRQTDALNDWKKQNNITIDEVFTDYYTGKTFERENYKKLKDVIKNGDYLIVKEVDRLGRNWDGIKKEWQNLKDNGINIIIIDIPILSDSLPNQNQPIEGLDLRFIKEQILTLMCYSAQKEREKISQRTKEGMAYVKENGTKSGRPIGKPRSNKSSFENFIKTLEYMVINNVGQKLGTRKTGFPIITFKTDLKKYYEKYNVNSYEDLLNAIRKDSLK